MSAPDVAKYEIEDEDSLADLEVGAGDVLANKYRVTKVLGAGGMGVVVEAIHLDLEEKVALKFLNSAVMHRDEAAVHRFLREAKAAVKLKSEHVARVRDVGTLDSGSPYIVLEYLEGQDLDQLLDDKGSVSVELAVLYVLQACEALAQAHAQGIIHRDLKPPNLFLTHRVDGSPSIKVLDFGISKLLSGTTTSGRSLTKTNVLIGSPLYMAPECWQSAKNADARSDIWSLGAILYELMAGAPAFPGESLPEVCRAVQFDTPKSLAMLREDVPRELDDVVMKSLAKGPHDRFQNIAEFAVELVPFGRSICRLHAQRSVRIIEGAGMLKTPLKLSFESEAPPPRASDEGKSAAAPAGGSAVAMAETMASGEQESVELATDPVPAPAPPRITAPALSESTIEPLPMSHSAEREPDKPRRWPLLLGALLLLGGIATAVVLSGGDNAPGPGEASSAPPPAQTTGEPTPPAIASSTVVAAPSASATATTDSSTSPPATAPKPPPGPKSPWPPRPTATATPPPPPASKTVAPPPPPPPTSDDPFDRH